MNATNLAQLLSMMLADHPSTLDGHGQWRADLPVFGGAHPTIDEGGGAASDACLWSWDATHLLVGRCPDELEIVER